MIGSENLSIRSRRGRGNDSVLLRSLLPAAAIVLLAPIAALAQAVPGDLTLEDALRIAQEHSPDYRLQANRLERSAIERRLAFQTTFLPQLNSGITLGARRYRSYTAENFDGVPLDHPYSNEGESSSTAQNVSMSMTLFSGESFMRYRASRASAEAAEVGVAGQRDALRVDISRRYYAVVQADQAIALERRLLERAASDLEATAKRFELGLVDQESVSGARIGVLRREQSVERAVGNARKARLDLLEAMGISEEADFSPVGDFPEPFDPGRLDVDALVSLARTSSPRILMAEARVDAAVAAGRAASGARLPTVRASASLGRTRTSAGFGSFLEVNPQNSDYNVALTVQIPVPFLRYAENANVAQARLNAADARDDLTRERTGIEMDVKRMIIDLENAYGEIELQERQVELMRERLSFLEERERVGQPIEYLVLESARDEAADAERAVLSARIVFQNLVLGLEQIVGSEVAP